MIPVSAHFSLQKIGKNNVVIYTGILLLCGNLETKKIIFLNSDNNVISKTFNSNS